MNNKKDDGMPLPTVGNHRDASHAGSAPNPAIAVGAQLASVRAEKGRSIDEMASRLKVSAAKVVALEAGDLAPLHDAAFAVGLVRSYAKVLGMDPEPLTDALRGVRHTNTPNLALPPSGAKASSMRRANVPLSWSTRRSDRRSWIWGGLAAVVIFILLGVWRVGNEPNGWLQRVKGEAASDVDAANPQAVSGAVVSTLPPVGANGMSGEPASAGTSTAASASASQGGSEAVVAALNAPTQSLAAAGADAGSAAASLATLAAVSSAHPGAGASAPLAPGVGLAGQAANSSAAPAAGTSRLNVAVTQDTWMSVKGADGRTVFSGIVHAGQSQNMDAVRPLHVTVGNMSGVSAIEQDGHAVNAKAYAGSGKNVARFTLP